MDEGTFTKSIHVKEDQMIQLSRETQVSKSTEHLWHAANTLPDVGHSHA